MIVQPDDLVKQVLSNSLAALQADPTPLQFIFQQKSAAELAEIIKFFGNNSINCRFAFPRQVSELPGLYINIAAGAEDDQVIGSDFPLPDDQPSGTELEVTSLVGTWLSITVSISCLSTNAALSTWLSSVVLWALIGARYNLNQLGFVKQRLSLRDLSPESRYTPDFVFRRDVAVSGTVPATAEDFTEYAILNEIIVVPTIEVPVLGTVNEAPQLTRVGPYYVRPPSHYSGIGDG